MRSSPPPSRPPGRLVLADPAARLALGMLLLGALAIGHAPIFVRLTDAGPSAIGLWRMVLSLPVLLVWLAAEHATTRTRKPSCLRDHLALGFAGFCFAGDLALWHWSIRLTSVANSTLLANFAPIFVTLVGWACFGERFTRAFLGGMALSLAGAVMLVGSSVSLSGTHLLGDALGIGTAAFYAAYMLAVRHLRQTFSTATIMTYSALVSAVLLLPVAIASGDALIPTAWTGWLALIGLGVISHAGGQSLIAYAFAHLPAAFTAVVLLLQPFVSALAAWVILAEPMRPAQIAGGVVMLAGVLIAGRGSRG